MVHCRSKIDCLVCGSGLGLGLGFRVKAYFLVFFWLILAWVVVFICKIADLGRREPDLLGGLAVAEPSCLLHSLLSYSPAIVILGLWVSCVIV